MVQGGCDHLCGSKSAGEPQQPDESRLFGTYSPSYLLYEALRKRGESEGDPECDGI